MKEITKDIDFFSQKHFLSQNYILKSLSIMFYQIIIFIDIYLMHFYGDIYFKSMYKKVTYKYFNKKDIKIF